LRGTPLRACICCSVSVRAWAVSGASGVRRRIFSAFRIAILTRQFEHRLGRLFDPALVSASDRAGGGTLTSKNAEIRWRFGTVPPLLSYCDFSSVLPRPGAPSPFGRSGGKPIEHRHGRKLRALKVRAFRPVMERSLTFASVAADRRAEKPASPKERMKRREAQLLQASTNSWATSFDTLPARQAEL
jgi:hypothetical protein